MANKAASIETIDQSAFDQYHNVASESCGARILFATDDFFAAAECMLQDSEPEFDKDKYTTYGKWMDGWETRRRREAGHDWCIIQLSGASSIKAIHADTAFFTGNHAPVISVSGAFLPKKNLPELENIKRIPHEIGREATRTERERVASLRSHEWTEIVPKTVLQPGYPNTRHNYILDIGSTQEFTHLRLNIFPDGGIARFKVYGEITWNPHDRLSAACKDVFSMQNGAKCLLYSNAHYGHPRNLTKPGSAANMGDGWETHRRLDRPMIIEVDAKGYSLAPGKEWSIFQLGTTARLVYIEIDTHHFIGNYPNTIEIEGLHDPQPGIDSLVDPHTKQHKPKKWFAIVERTRLRPNATHVFKKEIPDKCRVNMVRITMYPDGGISRVRMFGECE